MSPLFLALRNWLSELLRHLLPAFVYVHAIFVIWIIVIVQASRLLDNWNLKSLEIREFKKRNDFWRIIQLPPAHPYQFYVLLRLWGGYLIHDSFKGFKILCKTHFKANLSNFRKNTKRHNKYGWPRNNETWNIRVVAFLILTISFRLNVIILPKNEPKLAAKPDMIE